MRAAFAAFLLFLALSAAPDAPRAQQPTHLLTVVTAADAQTQAMAMILTLQALKRGASADILLCGPAGDLALAQGAAPALKTQMGPKSPRDMLALARQAGAQAQVCALYLPNAGLDASSLAEGVTVAAPPDVADVMMDPATRLFTF